MDSINRDSFIIVTGGAGFIGSAIVWRLNELGFNNILIVDNMPSSSDSNSADLEGIGEGAKWRNLSPLKFTDYIEADKFYDLVRTRVYYYDKPDFVFHLGACSSTTVSDMKFLIQNNFQCTKDICGWALSNEANFIYASSAATYGDGLEIEPEKNSSSSTASKKKGQKKTDQQIDTMPDDEALLHKLRPLNAYAFSKSVFDNYAYKNGLLSYIVGLKYFNVFGPNENHKGEMRSVANKAFAQIQSTDKLKLFKSHRKGFADGEQKRDFLYVKDAVEMTLFFALSKEANSAKAEDVQKTKGIFNIGSGEANSWNKLAKSLFKVMGKTLNIEYIDMPEKLRDKYQYYTCANINKLRNAGYLEKITPLADAIKNYVKNYLIPDKRLGD